MYSLATGQASCSSVSGSKISVRSTRKRVIIYNSGANAAFIGSSGVSTSTGFQVNPGTALVLQTTAEIYAVCNANETCTLSFSEEFSP